MSNNSKKPYQIHDIFVLIGFITYIFVILWGTLFKFFDQGLLLAALRVARMRNMFPLVTIPFNASNMGDYVFVFTSFRYTSFFFLNILVFMPYGIYLAYFTRNNKPIFTTFISSLIISLFIEVVQRSTLIGCFDFTDILTNVGGAVPGAFLFTKIYPRLSDKTIFILKIVGVLISVALFVALIVTFVKFLNSNTIEIYKNWSTDFRNRIKNK